MVDQYGHARNDAIVRYALSSRLHDHPQVSPSISHDTHGMEEYVGRMRRITLLVENIKLSRQRIRIATEISVL